MKSVEIKAAPFFELLRTYDTPMWEIFSQMIDGAPKILIFTNEEGIEIFRYQLPATQEELNENREIFTKEFSARIAEFGNLN